MNNTEDFVTYEQAITLQELGFNWECIAYYDFNKEIVPVTIPCILNSIKRVYAPMLAQTAKWLREKWDLHIAVSPFTDSSIDADGRKCEEWEFWDFGIMRASNGSFVADYGDREFDTYEAALSAGIDAALELIKKIINGNKRN